MKNSLWVKALNLIRKPDPSAVMLGRAADGSVLALPWRDRNEHVSILGASGSGKSTMLTRYMSETSRLRESNFLIDPHGNAVGSPYRNLLSCATHTIDFSSNRVVGFNPLACPAGTDPSVIVGYNVAGLSAVSGDERLSNFPTGERAIKTIISTLVHLKLTYCEAKHLIDPADHTLRRYAIEHVSDPETREDLKRLDMLASDGRRWRDFETETVFTRNRISRLLDSPLVRAMLGQTTNTLDIPAIMDSGGVLLANLNGGLNVPDATADLFGKLLTNTVLFHARRRTCETPVNVVIDEAHRYFSASIPSLLAEARKFRVSVVMAMLWLDQADKTMQPAILNGTHIKICFRLNDAEESERVARTIVPYRLERPVRTLIRPVLVGHESVWLANHSESDGETETDSYSQTKGTTEGISETEGEGEAHTSGTNSSAGQGESEGTAHTTGPNYESEVKRVSSGTSKQTASGESKSLTKSTQQSITHSYATSRSVTEGHSIGRSKTRSKGQSEALRPILKNMTTSIHSVQNEQYAAGYLLRSLRTGVAYINFVGADGPVATLFKVPPVAVQISEPSESGGIPLVDALKLIAERAETFVPPEPPKKKTSWRK